MLPKSRSCSVCPAFDVATNYRWQIVSNTCTAGQSVWSVLLAFAFMESLCIYGFRPNLQPVRGPIVSSKAYRRERSSIRKASRLQMVTLSQPATDSQLLALASTWPTLASTEALLTVELPQAVRPDRYSHRFTIQANAEVVAPESRGQR